MLPQQMPSWAKATYCDLTITSNNSVSLCSVKLVKQFVARLKIITFWTNVNKFPTFKCVGIFSSKHYRLCLIERKRKRREAFESFLNSQHIEAIDVTYSYVNLETEYIITFEYLLALVFIYMVQVVWII